MGRLSAVEELPSNKNNRMKTKYQEMYEYLTILMALGKLTSEEAATILAPIRILEARVKVLENRYHDAYAESKREELQQESEHEINDNVQVGEGEESERELK